MDAFNQLLIALATMDILFLLFSSYASIIVVGYEQDEPGKVGKVAILILSSILHSMKVRLLSSLFLLLLRNNSF